jgi:hypothetical protein
MALSVSKEDHVRGSGPVTIRVYGDYECPYTRALELVIGQLRRRDGDSFRGERYHGGRDEGRLRAAIASVNSGA